MADITNTNTDVNQTYDAKVLAEEVATGEEKVVPSVNVEADYEASKHYSEGSGDPAEVEPAIESPLTSSVMSPEGDEPFETEPTGDPADFRAMAQEVNPQLKA
ncbi:hypothetical protein H6G89_05190 [Oscillatoria sp. FACHB-1407]|uniref:hypothetical protein n=1 Tax=Oscillatoria sp. FACHB-1407 TaxID=2692847 RepID=UPI001688924C|nr:hypothetical protein [Oscillatoria sp. FACHB-1407]MBD2460433.1 hypothetical protein [Oscillatoria sp. FACHB-1407]